MAPLHLDAGLDNVAQLLILAFKEEMGPQNAAARAKGAPGKMSSKREKSAKR